jgi:Putative DNA-binding domain
MNVSESSAPEGSELERLQRWMQAVIAHPSGIAAGVASEEAQQSIGVDLERLEEVLAPSATLTASERLAIYCRSYHTRLLQCFREMFPALRHALGEELFNHFALDYLRHHPPRSYTLDQLADAFPQHLAVTRPDAEAPPDQRERWPDFIIELASLERAFLEVYDGAGCEGHALPRAVDILSLATESILRSRPLPVPCLRLFAFRYPVHTYMLAARRDEKPKLPAPVESFVAMTRWNYRVKLHELSAPQYALLEALDGHHTIGHILNRGLRDKDRGQPSLASARNWLCEWADKGFFESIEIPK